ncbi:MAG: hypothetical protein HY686_00395 [Chloroflexi bacterium]|nr:hypothetical protein [Chloroflexota bacterium]
MPRVRRRKTSRRRFLWLAIGAALVLAAILIFASRTLQRGSTTAPIPTPPPSAATPLPQAVRVLEFLDFQ